MTKTSEKGVYAIATNKGLVIIKSENYQSI
jgi:hypothetical protein